MIDKDSVLCLEKDAFFEQKRDGAENPFCRECSPFDYYKFEKGFSDERVCVCTNQDLLNDDFCENCNAFI